MKFEKMEVLSDLFNNIDTKFNELTFTLSEVQELLEELADTLVNSCSQLDPTLQNSITKVIKNFLEEKGYS